MTKPRSIAAIRKVLAAGSLVFGLSAIVLIAVGTFFLLTNLGLISISLRELLRVWWPVALIAVGLALFFTPGGKGR